MNMAEKHVTVIGGGNTAVDAALSCRLLGVEKVSLVALEEAAHMPAFELEVKEAIEAQRLASDHLQANRQIEALDAISGSVTRIRVEHLDAE